jgi:hypothetical protein
LIGALRPGLLGFDHTCRQAAMGAVRKTKTKENEYDQQLKE